MFVILTITMIAFAVLCCSLISYADNYGAHFSNFAGLLGLLSGTISFLVAVFLAFATYSWYAAEHQAKIINREYNTNYTQEEVFYASEVIDTIREIQRGRNEVTLNVNTEKK